MQFGSVAIGKAEGAILAHSVRAAHLRKGRALSADDVAALKAAGVTDVTVARLEADDVAEDEAAARLAKASAARGIRIGAAFTGRANLYAETSGLALIDAGRV